MLRIALAACRPRALGPQKAPGFFSAMSTATSPPQPGEELNQAPPPPLTVKQVYKNLLHLGKDFPKGYEYFRDRCKSAFLKNRDVADAHQVEVLLARAVYVTKELEALYMLKKYRTLKKRYYAEELK